jgi:hypothetical protein
MATKTAIENWTHIANTHAGNCFMRNFSARRGVYYDPEHKCLILFSNNPYSEPQGRVDELEEVRTRIAVRGWKELGFGSYPPDGEDAHYSYAMVVDAQESDQKALTDLYKDALAHAFKGDPVLFTTDTKDIEEFVERLSQDPPKPEASTKQKPAKAKRASKRK